MSREAEPASAASAHVEEALLELGDRVVGLAEPDEQVEVVVVDERETEARVHAGGVESLSVAHAAGVGIRVVRDGRQGFAWAGTLEHDVVVETLAAARDNAMFATADEFAGLAEPDGVAPAALDLFDESAEAFPTEAKIDLALELERATLNADERISALESSEYVDFAETAAIVSTRGMRTSTRQSGAYLAVYALAGRDAETQTGFGYSIGRGPGVLDPSVAAHEAAHRATRMLGARKPPTGRLNVVLDPWVVAQLLGVVGSMLSGEAVLKGRSPFAERLGEPVAAPSVRLVDDPTDPEVFSATTVDGEGLATRRNVLIDEGVLVQFVYDSRSARRAGTASTGSAVRRGFSSTPAPGCAALSLAPGTKTPAEILADIGDGVYICDVAGLHSGVNPVSGDLSCGAEGLRIRDGVLAEPLREFTIGSTVQRLLTEVLAIGNDRTRMPMSADGVTLAVGDVTISGE